MLRKRNTATKPPTWKKLCTSSPAADPDAASVGLIAEGNGQGGERSAEVPFWPALVAPRTLASIAHQDPFGCKVALCMGERDAEGRTHSPTLLLSGAGQGMPEEQKNVTSLLTSCRHFKSRHKIKLLGEQHRSQASWFLGRTRIYGKSGI